MRNFRDFAAAVLLLTHLGCGSDSPSQPGNADASVDLAGPEGPLGYAPCPASTRVGGFAVLLGTDTTTIEGKVHSGVNPRNVWPVEAEEGGCRLTKGPTYFCDPACDTGTQTCGEGGVCVAYPLRRSAGTVRVEGLKAEVVLPPGVDFYYSTASAAVALPHPGFDPGAAIRLVASGAAVNAFALRGQGVEPLALGVGDIRVERGQAVTLSWTPPVATSPARIYVSLDIAHHGGVLATIECDGVVDDGSLQIPGGLTSKLLDKGVAGFPSIEVSRRTADSIDTNFGCVELLVSATQTRVVIIPGVISCQFDDDCPAGQTCMGDLKCG